MKKAESAPSMSFAQQARIDAIVEGKLKFMDRMYDCKPLKVRKCQKAAETGLEKTPYKLGFDFTTKRRVHV